MERKAKREMQCLEHVCVCERERVALTSASGVTEVRKRILFNLKQGMWLQQAGQNLKVKGGVQPGRKEEGRNKGEIKRKTGEREDRRRREKGTGGWRRGGGIDQAFSRNR